MNKKKITRRTFLAGTAVAAAGCATASKNVVHGPKRVSANEKLNIAGIGAGGRAEGDLGGVRTENIVALCDPDWRRAAKSFKRWPNAKKYKDFRRMLDKEKDIDAVVIATPDHTHAVAAMAAMQLGMHVYVEKPMTHSVYEARMLAQAARQNKVATQMGNQGHSGEGARKLCEMVWSGALGDIKTVHIWTNRPVWPQDIDRPTGTPKVPAELDWDVWLGPAPYRPYNPVYLPFNWRGWWDFGCGALGDMGCHIMDAPFWAMKLTTPTSVEPWEVVGGNNETGPKASVIKYEFPQRGDMCPVTVFWYDGGKLPRRPEGIPADEQIADGGNGSLLIGTKGMACAGEYGGDPRLLPASKMEGYRFPTETIPRIPGNNHHQNWVRACKGGPAACSNFDYAAALTEMVSLGNVALRVGEKINWDADNMRVTNVPGANKYVQREYRRGWHL
jgi:predicted dehydrogenase